MAIACNESLGAVRKNRPRSGSSSSASAVAVGEQVRIPASISWGTVASAMVDDAGPTTASTPLLDERGDRLSRRASECSLVDVPTTSIFLPSTPPAALIAARALERGRDQRLADRRPVTGFRQHDPDPQHPVIDARTCVVDVTVTSGPWGRRPVIRARGHATIAAARRRPPSALALHQDRGPPVPYPARMVTARASTGISGRDAVIADVSLGGRELCRALSAAHRRRAGAALWADAADRHHAAAAQVGRRVLVAVGGYGLAASWHRSATSTSCSSTRASRTGIENAATTLWYPLWDAGLKLGHAVRSFDDQLSLAGDDLDTATSLLSTRFLAGDEELATRLAIDGRSQLAAPRSSLAGRPAGSPAGAPLRQAGDVAFLLEPDLKDGHGGAARRADAVVGRRCRPRRARRVTSSCWDVVRRHARRCARRPPPVDRPCSATSCGWRTRTTSPWASVSPPPTS